ncbi:MAG: cadmium-translocating P-type ATPase [Acidobacteria bacterium]|nr:cadmium-translocating P-type ATPase [Acidobacteriota bacterium]
MSAVAAVAASSQTLPPLPLCAHCGLPVAGLFRLPSGPCYCCGGCALAHRLTGGASGHGQVSGLLMAVGVGAFLAMNVMMCSFVLYTRGAETDRAAGEAWVRWALLVLATPALFLLGLPFLNRGLKRLKDRSLDTDALIVIGVAAAFALSVRSVLSGGGPIYLDTAMGILLFVTIGRYLEASSRARTTDALVALVQELPSEASRVVNGLEERVSVDALRPGDVIRVRPGERIAVDGTIVDGTASVSEAEITGESVPASRGPGDHVAAGTLNQDGSLLIEARRTGPETTVARLVKLVAESRAGRYTLAPLVDRLSAAFVPFVLLVAAGTLAYWTHRAGPGEGLMNALSVLLIACPCAIGIATPLASTAAVGRAAAAGVLVRSGAVFEALARAKRVFLDKTGTLTTGILSLADVRPAQGFDRDGLLALAAALEHGSEHPVGRAICSAAGAGEKKREEKISLKVDEFRARPGQGVEGRIGGEVVRVGTAAFAGAPDASAPPGFAAAYVSCSGTFAGTLLFSDRTRPESAEAVAALRGRGLSIEVLSGDLPSRVTSFAADFPGLRAAGGLSPEGKLDVIRSSVRAGESPVMVGDGINDAPALGVASAGVTLESGTDLAREVADVTILGGDLRKLPWTIDLAHRTVRTAHLNLFWAFFYNGIGITLAVCGLLHPLFGAVAMIASSLLVVVHSQRLTRFPLPGVSA